MNPAPLPPGKLNIRHRQMRNVWQAFAGNRYLDGASGDTVGETLEALRSNYAPPPGLIVTIHARPRSQVTT
jgi:hypothetical protein